MTGKFGLRTRFSRRAAGIAVTMLAVAGLLGAGVASASRAGAATRPGSTATAAEVPWRSVGTGWVLTLYSTSTSSKHEPTTLYLVSPSGAKYQIYSWKASATVPFLVAWAGNKTQALLAYETDRVYQSGTGQYSELNLRTGKLTAVTLAGKVDALGYTLPSGYQILGGTPLNLTNPKMTLARYTLAGKLVKVLVTQEAFGISAVYSPNGTDLAVSARDGLELVSNAGGVLRQLPIPDIQTVSGCAPIRWWNASTIVARCLPKGSETTQLWLVPASGAKPSALTPVRKPGGDYGDIDAWQLSSGLYLQSLGICDVDINKQAKNGSITSVTVTGAANNPLVVTATGSRLLVQNSGCGGRGQLLWFNPATGAEQWLFKTDAGSTIAYNNEENANLS
jgi:hypothetical protein